MDREAKHDKTAKVDNGYSAWTRPPPKTTRYPDIKIFEGARVVNKSRSEREICVFTSCLPERATFACDAGGVEGPQSGMLRGAVGVPRGSALTALCAAGAALGITLGSDWDSPREMPSLCEIGPLHHAPRPAGRG